MKVRFLSAGDRALVVEFGERVRSRAERTRAPPRCDDPFVQYNTATTVLSIRL